MKPKVLPEGSEAAVCRGSIKKIFLKMLQNPQAGKQIYLVFFFDTFAGLLAATLLKKRFPYKRFPVKFAKFLRKPILHNIFRRLVLSSPRIPLKPNEEAIRECLMLYVIYDLPIFNVSCEITWKFTKILEKNSEEVAGLQLATLLKYCCILKTNLFSNTPVDCFYFLFVCDWSSCSKFVRFFGFRGNKRLVAS